MSDLPPARDHDASGGWLTPTAAAIAGLALAVLALSGRGAWMLTVEAFLTRNGSASFADTVMLNAFVQALVAAGALLLSARHRRGVAHGSSPGRCRCAARGGGACSRAAHVRGRDAQLRLTDNLADGAGGSVSHVDVSPWSRCRGRRRSRGRP